MPGYGVEPIGEAEPVHMHAQLVMRRFPVPAKLGDQILLIETAHGLHELRREFVGESDTYQRRTRVKDPVAEPYTCIAALRPCVR